MYAGRGAIGDGVEGEIPEAGRILPREGARSAIRGAKTRDESIRLHSCASVCAGDPRMVGWHLFPWGTGCVAPCSCSGSVTASAVYWPTPPCREPGAGGCKVRHHGGALVDRSPARSRSSADLIEGSALPTCGRRRGSGGYEHIRPRHGHAAAPNDRATCISPTNPAILRQGLRGASSTMPSWRRHPRQPAPAGRVHTRCAISGRKLRRLALTPRSTQARWTVRHPSGGPWHRCHRRTRRRVAFRRGALRRLRRHRHGEERESQEGARTRSSTAPA